MSSDYLPTGKTIRTAGPSPRNHWLGLATAMECLADGRSGEAWHILDALRESAVLGRDIIDPALHLAELALGHGAAPRLVLPGDYLRTLPGKPFQPRLRTFSRPQTAPGDFPSDMSLPPPIGNANDFSLLSDVARQYGFTGPLPDLRLRLVLVLRDAHESDQLADDLARLHSEGLLPAGTTLCLFGPATLHDRSFPLPADWNEGLLWQVEAGWRAERMVEGADVVMFLPLAALADRLILERTLRFFAVSDNLCLALTPVGAFEAALSPAKRPNVLADWMVQDAWRTDPQAWRRIDSVAFAVNAERFRRVGGFEPRFATEPFACRELALRLSLSGCYFVPLALRADLPATAPVTPHPGDQALFAQLDPGHPGRAATGRYERPKVSVCIPAYCAEHYLPATIESVLSQDYQDLEICIADDGSPDETVKLLKSLADEPRIRWVTGPGGGMAHASNRAMGLARGLYLALLDADTRLIPGAIGRLVDHLDANPAIGCIYASGAAGIEPGGASLGEARVAPFNREAAMIGPVEGHFPMLRHQHWNRIGGLGLTAESAILHDLVLRLAEVTPIHQIDATMHHPRPSWIEAVNPRRLADANETLALHRGALKRLGMDRFWSVTAADRENPATPLYCRRGEGNRVFFWPDYSTANPYQRMLYARTAEHAEVMAGDIDLALDAARSRDGGADGQVVFHLHWLNRITEAARSADEAAQAATAFLAKLKDFRSAGGRLVWTIHNVISHDLPFADVETSLAQEIADIADAVHVHSRASLPEIDAFFTVAREKLHIARHGAYHGAYPDFVDRARARAELQIDSEDDVILFIGKIRPYKGIEELLAAFRAIVMDRPRARLVLAGSGPAEALLENAALSPSIRRRITLANRFIDDMELQLFFNAADFAVYPYRRILTSGSLLLALSFGVPAVVPAFGMTQEVIGDGEAGIVYDAQGAAGALETALRQMLQRIDRGEHPAMTLAARRIAQAALWEDIDPLLFGSPG